MKILGLVMVMVLGVFAGENFPAWYLNPPSDDETYFYGVGEGETLRQAKDDALRDIASRLSITISSKVSKNSTQSTSGNSSLYHQDVKVNVESEIKKIVFNSFEVVSGAQNGTKPIVLIKVDKEKFFNNQLEILDDIRSKLNHIQTESADRGILEQYAMFQELVPEADKAKTIVSVLSTYAIPFQRDGVQQELADFQHLRGGILSKIEFYITADNDSRYNADTLKEALGKEKIKIARFLNPKNSNVVILNLESETVNKQVYGFSMAVVRTAVTLKSNEGNILSSFVVESKGSSTLNAGAALKNAGANFKKEVMKKGVWGFLGIE
ncbi:MAG: LPP20 family lipoprotein [Sulfuricurvum sp.]|nr:LPP20 family lipoprotein [Sulfuricurvum sp.]